MSALAARRSQYQASQNKNHGTATSNGTDTAGADVSAPLRWSTADDSARGGGCTGEDGIVVRWRQGLIVFIFARRSETLALLLVPGCMTGLTRVDSTLESRTCLTAAPSPNYIYDLVLTCPLPAQLQACNTAPNLPSSFGSKVQGLDPFQNNADR